MNILSAPIIRALNLDRPIEARTGTINPSLLAAHRYRAISTPERSSTPTPEDIPRYSTAGAFGSAKLVKP